MQTVQHRQSFCHTIQYILGLWSRLTALTDRHQSVHVLTSSLTNKIQMVGLKLNQALEWTTLSSPYDECGKNL